MVLYRNQWPVNCIFHFAELHFGSSIRYESTLFKKYFFKCYIVKRKISFDCFSEYLFLFLSLYLRNISALVRELLSNNSLFVSRLYKDKSLALRTRDLIFFTSDHQTVNYYTTIHC